MENSQQGDAEMLVAEDVDWTVAACDAIQDIFATLQSTGDDVQPQSDAPNYEALCCKAHDACSRAAASSGAATGGQHGLQSVLGPKALDCLQQLSTATMQLAAAVCCEPEVALPLIAASGHAAAMDQLKGAVKALITHFTSCIDLAQRQQRVAVTGATAQASSISSNSQQAMWQGLAPALSAAAQHLLHMAVTSAGFMTAVSGSSASSQQVPREMCSMSALNLSWSNLTRLLVAMPERLRLQVLQVQDLLQGLSCALQQLQAAVADLPVQPRARQEVLVRFWLQAVSRFTSAAWEAACQPAMAPLLHVTLEVYDAVARPEYTAVQDILQQLVQPRLMACMSSLLSSSTDPSNLEAKLEFLLQPQPPQPTAAAPAGQAASSSQQQQQQKQAKAHLMVVLDLLQNFLPNWPVDLVSSGCVRLFTWAISTASTNIGVLQVLPSGDPGCAEQMQDGSSGGEAALQLLQDVQQACLVGATACCAVLQDQQDQQAQLLAAMHKLAVCSHPVVSFLARQLLADVVSIWDSNSCGSMATQQLCVLHKLLAAAAAVSATPAAGTTGSCGNNTSGGSSSSSGSSSNNISSHAVLDAMAAVLQAWDQQCAAGWLQQHLLQAPSSLSGDSPGWLDARACSLLASECGLLLRLAASGVPGLLPVNLQVEELWMQLWAAAQQLVELLQPQQLTEVQHTADSSTAADCILVLHQLCWMLQAMHGLLDLSTALQGAAVPGGTSGTSNSTSGSTSDSNMKQGGALFAWELLITLEAGGSFASNTSSMQGSPTCMAVASAKYACTAAALQLLASAGQLQVPEDRLSALVQLLLGLAHSMPGLHGVMAGVCGNVGAASKADHAPFQELFQLLLSSPHWAVQHAAFEGLLQLLRHSSSLGTGIVRLLPQHMRSSATEATQDVINAVKAHLYRQPEPQAQQAYMQLYPQLAVQHMQQLATTQHTGSHCSTHEGDLQLLQQLVATSRGSLPPTSGGSSGGGLIQPTSAAAAPQGVGATGDMQGLLAQAAGTAKSLQGLDKALAHAEADVRLLLSAASVAAREQALSTEGILVISKQGSSLMGSCTSMISRLRALQDGLSTLRG